LRDLIGVETLMWGSDYPHTESTFPRSRQILGEILRGLDDDDIRRVTASNAARLYSFDLPDPSGS
jgi:predicted TIM-barrel fold metal-dependent hydrolase